MPVITKPAKSAKHGTLGRHQGGRNLVGDDEIERR
jgi:hypothetical protein